jgi:hypothetical protein
MRLVKQKQKQLFKGLQKQALFKRFQMRLVKHKQKQALLKCFQIILVKLLYVSIDDEINDKNEMIYAEEEKVDIIRDSNQFYKSSIDQELPMLSEDSEDEDEDEEHNNNYNEYDIFAGDRYPKKKKGNRRPYNKFHNYNVINDTEDEHIADNSYNKKVRTFILEFITIMYGSMLIFV